MAILTLLVNPRTGALERRQSPSHDQQIAAKSSASWRSLQIKSSRIWRDIITTSKYGGIPGTTGMDRLSLSDADRQVRDWFVTEARALDLEVIVDDMGNIFAILPGHDLSLPPIGMGSHLDTQANGMVLPRVLRWRMGWGRSIYARQ